MNNRKNKIRLAVLASHPIEYQGPLFKKIAEHPKIDLMVYFCWDFGVKETYEPSFGRLIKWKIPLLEGYRFKFLKNAAFKKTSANFFGEVNFGVIPEIIKKKHDAVLILGWQVFTDWLAVFTAFFTRTPIFLRGENPFSQEILKPKWKLSLKKIILGRLFGIAKAIFYIGEENRKFYKYYGVPDGKLIFMPYAVDNERFFQESKALSGKKNKLKKDFGISSDKTVILCAGKLIGKKRPIDVLKAYSMVKGGNKALVFMGDGPLKKEIWKFVEENGLSDVHITGFIDPLEIKKFYAMADIFVLPSGAGETWGLVVNEAMCFGLPVIVSDIAGSAPDLVKNGVNGYVFPVGNIEELFSKIKELAENPRKAEAFGEKSLEIVKKYDFKKDIESILKALESDGY